MKKLLLSLFICVFGFIGFSSAGSIIYTGSVNVSNFPTYRYLLMLPIPNSIPAFPSMPTYISNISCILTNVSNDFTFSIATFSIGNTYNTSTSIKSAYNVTSPTYEFSYSDNRRDYSFAFYSNKIDGITVSFDYECVVGTESSNIASLPVCSPQYTSEECQSEYDLIPSSDLSTCNNDLQSCQASLSGRNNTLNNCSNNLLSCESSLSSCIQSNCPIDTGDVMWSAIWINGIQHLGKPVINVSIPDNIYWDYTTNDESFDLYVGSGYDQEYIDSVLSINSYRPTSEDFTYMFVSGLTLIFPYIFVALLIIFIWKLIKRIFK